MPEKMKLNLDDLKVQSFVTSAAKEAEQVKGGASCNTCYRRCSVGDPCCPTVPPQPGCLITVLQTDCSLCCPI